MSTPAPARPASGPAATPAPAQGPGRPLHERISPALVMAIAAALAFVVILYLGRHLTTFLYDEWNIFINRREWDADTLLRPHNEHLVAAPV